MNALLFHPDFQVRPYWWDAYAPASLPERAPPADTRVAIIGAGYAGLAAALELNAQGLDCVVLDANEPGFGGSTRNGGMVSGGVNVGKRYLSKPMPADEAAPFLQDAADAFTHIENLVTREAIACHWKKSGYFLGAWCRSHYEDMAKKAASLNANAQSGAYLVPPEKQREEIGSDYYRGGMVIERAAQIHPALYFKGLLDLCTARGITDPLQHAGDKDHAARHWLDDRDAARRDLGWRCHHRHQRLYRRCHAAAQAPRRARRLLHHRHRRARARYRRVAVAQGPELRRHPPHPHLLSNVAGREAPHLRGPRQVRPHRSCRHRGDTSRLHDSIAFPSSRDRRSRTPGPAMSPSPSTRCRIWGSSTISTMRWAATGRASR